MGRDDCEDLRRSVKKLHFGSWEEKEVAAAEIKRLAKQDLRRRKFMAELGVIPPLVDMVGSEVVARRRSAVQALIVLAHGSYTNKALMVEAGILSKLPEKIDVTEELIKQEFLQLLLSVSSLARDSSQFPVINSSRIIPFVVSILETTSSNETRGLCLETLYILSSVLGNSGILVRNGVVGVVLRLCSLREVSEKALAVVGNLVVTQTGKKALEENPWVPEGLIETMARWEEKPKCQELAVYILMILAHQSSAQREKMAKADIVPVLLEVALLGSPLGQKRALKLLQWFKDERQRSMEHHSGPQMRRNSTMGSPVHPKADEEGKRLLKKIVKQSLYKNMETITRRANCSSGEPSRLKTLAINSSSKSLPY
ncbi:PREDICTED: U-box domain-containing protein 45-like [Ipomoea nil]|uniref:U-box domain-containing protein 45-like n=1 Tax=Ipomoea nil TaxID=35883 RepID=UPI000901F730|nr:PREDICTED: U-box domain-containing protein 45-like [Ipomoea nil]